MKRRNIDAGKFPRRSAKRNTKFSDNVYGNSFVYVKFIGIWVLILLGDFIVAFRFEYVWPAWLLAQSVYETFKYQGLIYAVFFICIAITTDTICILLLPIQYLFFLASTYVWIHYVWHTDKGFCVPTVCLWLLIMYVEVTQRLHDLKVGQFHASLGQPFAAHCIGHPIITLGISFKSYVFYRIKLRTQHQVRKENLFHFELLKQALPIDLQHNHVVPITDQGRDEGMQHCNGFVSHQNTNSKKHPDKLQKSLQDLSLQVADVPAILAPSKQHAATTNSPSSPSPQRKLSSKETFSSNSSKLVSENDAEFVNSSISDTELRKRNLTVTQNKKYTSSSSDFSSSNAQTCKSVNKSNSNEVSSKFHKNTSTQKLSQAENNKCLSTAIPTTISNLCKDPIPPSTEASNSKIELVSTSSVIEQLETTISKLKAELASAQKNSTMCKSQLEQMSAAEQVAKTDLAYLKRDHESLQTKYNTLVSNKEKDRVDLQSLEKRLKAEIDSRESTERLLQEEKRRRKEDEATATITLSNRDKESAEILKVTKSDLEEKINNLEKQLKEKEVHSKKLEIKLKDHQAREKSIKESETLMSALEAMQEKNMLLEKSLSAETRLKLDLFSALGDAKRQMELAHAALYKREAELTEMKARMSDFLSVMPEQRQMRSSTPHYSANFLEKSPPLLHLAPPQEFSASFAPPHPGTHPPSIIQTHPNIEQNIHMQPVHLDPNAAVYTPSTSSV